MTGHGRLSRRSGQRRRRPRTRPAVSHAALGCRRLGRLERRRRPVRRAARISGRAAPIENAAAEGSAVWIGRTAVNSEMPSSSLASAARAPRAINWSAPAKPGRVKAHAARKWQPAYVSPLPASPRTPAAPRARSARSGKHPRPAQPTLPTRGNVCNGRRT